ncbi:exoribonuclease, putative [Plasmodium gallinaceum]|uniref:Exoribonuclease, putative n=1 Tax=Plasmodium gallinaceum TaxID=5849 RepID=A0A1J1GVP1_PLAGA|nr:exoribonuclease, putative [Plasmodium gallinaceum]CRG95083.1 exoribonuclease, putative [Plasmodium gallinaceum]
MKNKPKAYDSKDKLRKTKTKKDLEKTCKKNVVKRLEVAFFGHRNIFLKDIHNFIVNLRIGKYILRNEIFEIKNNECLNNLIIVIIPNLSNFYIKDISTDNVFNKLQKNNNFRKIHTENCVRNNCSNIIFKSLGVSVLKNKRKFNFQNNFNIDKYLLTKDQMIINKYPTESDNYMNFENIEYNKWEKQIYDMHKYLSKTMNSTYVVYLNTYTAQNDENECNRNVIGDEEKDLNENIKENDISQKNIFTDEHIKLYTEVLEKLLKVSKQNKNQLKGSVSISNQNNDCVNSLDKEVQETAEQENNEKNENPNMMNLGLVINDKMNEIDHLKYKDLNDMKMREANNLCSNVSNNNEKENKDKNKSENYIGEFDLDNIFSIDCEMCETINNQRELTKITVVDAYMNIVYDSYVVPDNKITNYLTLYSGINESTLENVKTKLKDVQENLKKFLNNKSILIGHSLENDLHALKISHPYVIDTSIIYSNSNYFSKPSLFQLSKKYLNIIMKRENGHNSIDDAKISMFLALKKISELDTNDFHCYFQPLSFFLNKANFKDIKNNIIYDEDITYKYEKNMCIFDSKNKYIEERVPKNFLRNCFHCICENDDECTENLILNIKNKNKIKNYLLILREYENLCNEKIYNCIKNVNNKDFKVEDNEKIFEIPTRVEANDTLNKLSANIEKIYNNMDKNDALILLSFNNNYLAEEKVKETFFLAKDIFYSQVDINDKLNNINEKINSIEKMMNKKKKSNDCSSNHFYEFLHLLYTYDKYVVHYLNENKTNDKNIYIMNSLTNLKNNLIINNKKREFNGWFSILLKN